MSEQRANGKDKELVDMRWENGQAIGVWWTEICRKEGV